MIFEKHSGAGNRERQGALQGGLVGASGAKSGEVQAG